MSESFSTSYMDERSDAATGAGEVELLLFEIGGELFGCDASQVKRVDRPGNEAIALPSLGELRSGNRALVFLTDELGEAQLCVDLVRGVVTVSITELRRMPPVARARSFAVGMWIGRDQPVLLIDLPETVRSSAA